MNDYGAITITNTYQNLKMDEEEKKNTNNEIMKSFDLFLKNYRSGDIHKYR